MAKDDLLSCLLTDAAGSNPHNQRNPDKEMRLSLNRGGGTLVLRARA